MPSIRLFRRLLIACLLASTGCATLPSFTPVDAQAAADAEAMYRQGELERSAVAFLNLASRSGSDDAAHFRLRAAEARRDNGDLKGAAIALDGIKRRRLPGDEPLRLDLLDAEIALDRGDAEFAESRIRDIDAEVYPVLRLRVLELRARAQAASSRPLAAARTRARMDGLLQGLDRDRNRDALLAVLATIPAAERQQRAGELPQNDALWPWLNQAASGSSSAPGDTALRPLAPVGSLVRSPASGGKVALLLPMSGPIGTVAAAIRDGFFTAYFADPNEQRPQVTVYDAGRNADDALAAYGRAVADGVDRVVGPLQREAVGRLFQQALPVRVLALNHPDSGAPPPPGSAEFGLPPDVEGTQAAERMLARGIRSSAILIAPTEWAERASQAFRARLEQEGGRVVGQATLASNEVNYRDAIRSATTGLAASTTGDDPNAISGSGIFISMLPQQARLLVPQLKIANITAPVFATSHVYAGERNVGLDRDLDGVEFSDAPWMLGPMLGKPDRDEIINQISSANASGARLFALGMDAYNLLGVIDALLSNPGQYAEGATGQLTADRQGRIFRTLAWGQFENGVARPSLGKLTSQFAQP
ncbi:MAG: penicillin-binding protein activator [Dokdonella sp.]